MVKPSKIVAYSAAKEAVFSSADIPCLEFASQERESRGAGGGSHGFRSRDPIGFAGGDVNIYAYVQNQPVDFSDPYGLLNPAKTSVGLINASRGIQSIAKGVGTIAAGTIAIPFTGGISGPTADTIGAAQISLGFANLNRGMQQASEAYSENMDEASWKNLLGLAPFGQKFDDPCEPGPIEYFSGVWDKIVADPYNAAKGAIKDFFAFD